MATGADGTKPVTAGKRLKPPKQAVLEIGRRFRAKKRSRRDFGGTSAVGKSDILFAVLTPYIVVCIALIIKPGPDLMCTLATALSDGKARASTLMAGLVLGCWLWIWLLAAGVASFFTSHPTVMVAELNTGGRPSWTRQLHVRAGFDILFRHEKDIV